MDSASRAFVLLVLASAVSLVPVADAFAWRLFAGRCG